jgi:hypothetical protein
MRTGSVTQAQARKVIEDIFKDNGSVSEASLAQIPPAVRQEVEQALLIKDQKIGAAVLT